MDARLDDRLGRVRGQRSARHPRHQRPRLGTARPGVRGPPAAGELPRFQFLDPGAHDSYADWELAATTVALLRAEAGRCPHDTQLRGLVGELSTVSEELRTRWAAHDVRIHHNGTKQFHHPAVGALELGHHTFDLPAEDAADLPMTIYTAGPGTPSDDALRLLASWAATHTAPTTTDAATPATERP